MITKEFFGKKPCGCEVDKYVITNKNGASVEILTMGGIMHKLFMPDRDGNMADIICGFDTVEGYLTGGGYDHNFNFKDYDGSLKKQAEMYDEVSGRVMSVFTDQPGVQLYSGNMMTDPVPSEKYDTTTVYAFDVK